MEKLRCGRLNNAICFNVAPIFIFSHFKRMTVVIIKKNSNPDSALDFK